MIKLNNKITRNVCKVVSAINYGDFFEYRGTIYQSFGYDFAKNSARTILMAAWKILMVKKKSIF